MVRAVSACGHFRAVGAVTTTTVNTLRQMHQTSPLATAALGRALTGAYLLASELKGNERVMIQILGNGPLREVFVEASPSGDGRGYVRNPRADIPMEGDKLRVSEGIGTSGTLTVVKDLGIREPYRGVIPLVSGEIGKDLTHYLAVSEQIPSAVALGVYVEPDLSVGAAGGYLVQTMPEATSEEISVVEENIRTLPVPTELIRTGRTPQEILADVLRGYSLKWLAEHPLRFRCACSRDRIGSALVAMGEKEIRQMIQRGGGAEVTCEFCREAYHYSGEELEDLLRDALPRTVSA
jgi:molecular chaperone Hsp33